MRVLVTGASGFIGGAVCREFVRHGEQVNAAVRRAGSAPEGCREIIVPDIGRHGSWKEAVSGNEFVVHCAARVHVMREQASDPFAEFHRVNVGGTRRLAEAAAEAGVRRFLFISTVKVNGEETSEKPFDENDPPNPRDAYGRSKWEAEQEVLKIGVRSEMETVILRLPLVYGPGVKANFRALMRLCARGVPLPFGGIGNARSLLYLGNLTDAVALCLTHPAAARKIFLLRDGEDLSTSALVRRLYRVMGKSDRCFALPPVLLHLMALLTNRKSEIARLVGSLVVDDGRIRHELGWRPPFSVDEGLAATSEWFLSRGGA